MFFLFCAIGVRAQDTPAIYKFEKGKTYKYLQELKVDITQELPGQTMNITVDGTVTSSMNILDVLSTGNFKCKTTIDNALVMVESPQGTQTMGKELAGKAFDLEIKQNGETIKDDSLLKGIDPQDMQVVSRVLSLLPKLSDNVLSIGTKWTIEKTDTTKANGNMVTKSKTIYTVKEKKQVDAYDCFLVEIIGDSETSGTMQQGGMDLNVNGEGKTQGTMLFAVKEGLVIQMTGDDNSEQTITVPSQQNMRIPMTQHSTIKLELLK